ncbi:porin [Oligella urethralis]|uniref:porin n=1 Tax=Oligella urethralis TaxID=90245 RepID=UPI0030B8D171
MSVGCLNFVHADTSLTLYGVLDAGITHQRISGMWDGSPYSSKSTGLLSGGQSGNRWGLKVTESLGNGTAAVVQLESGFELTTGESKQGGRLFGRQATLGLQNKSWGRIDVGRQTNMASKFRSKVLDTMDSSYNQLAVGASFSSMNTVRYDNMVLYQSPNVNGFQAGVGYSFAIDGEQVGSINGEKKDNTALTSGLRYGNGPFEAFITYDQIKLRTQDTTMRAWSLGMAYDFDILKLSMAVGNTRNGWFAGQDFASISSGSFVAADGLDFNSYLIGINAPIGKGNIRAMWQMADPSHGAQRSRRSAFVGDNLDTQQIFSLGYTYKLSKRTNLYAYGSYARHVLFQKDLTSKLVSAGIRHRF